MEKEENKSISAWLLHCDAGPILSRSSDFGVMMKRCSRPVWRHCYWKRRALWFDLGFVSRQHVLISLGSTVDYSKANVRHRHVFLLKHTHAQTDRQTDGRTHTWGRGEGKAWVLLVISNRYTNTKDLCDRRRASRSAEFLSGSRPHSLRFYSLSPMEVLSVHRVPLTGSELLKKHVGSLLNWRRKTRLFPLELSATLFRAVSRLTSFVQSRRNPLANWDFQQN